MLARRVEKTGQSSTMQIAARAFALKEQGIDIINFNIGEPDFPTPEYIKKAAIRAINDNQTKYTTNSGIYNLRKAICEKLLHENHVQYHPEEILVTNGAKQAVYNAVLASVDDGDEVIIPAPYWPSFPEMVRIACGKPVFIEGGLDNGFKISARQLEKAITSKTKAFILNNPCNPTGAVYSRQELSILADILIRNKVNIISDEIYEKLVFDDFKYTCIASISEKVKNNTIIVNGASKAFAMTGWRLGYAAGPAEWIKAMDMIQSHSTSAASTISQFATLTALQEPQKIVMEMVAEFQKRRDYMVKRLKRIKGINCSVPQGAFYLFPEISFFFGKSYNGFKINNSVNFVECLLEEAKTAMVPGSGFGMEGYVRISYANSMDNLEKGMDNIENVLSKLA
ncbi:MAG: pyridoxal phosphate-dependent aminotransferase [Calditrichaceae bacterium]|nr:pyridoxal phosphate-dependent aminotransferase [Calditrichaceae bacterium]